MRQEEFKQAIPETEKNADKAEIAEFATNLTRLLHKYYNEIPLEVVSNEGEAKARKAWWMMLIGGLELIEIRVDLSHEMRQEIINFIDKYATQRPILRDDGGETIQYKSDFNARLTRNDDINEANKLIEKVLAELKQKL